MRKRTICLVATLLLVFSSELLYAEHQGRTSRPNIKLAANTAKIPLQQFDPGDQRFLHAPIS